MESFSTRGLPVGRKVPFWNQISSETFAEMEVVPTDRSRFDGQLYRQPIGPLALADAHSSSAVLHHTEAHVARATEHSYTLVAPIIGDFRVAIGRQPEFDLRVGEFCLLDQARAYRLLFDRAVRTFAIVLPHRFLSEFVPDPERLVGIRMQPLDCMSRMLSSLLHNLSREMDAGGTSALGAGFAQSLAGFIASAYSRHVEVEETSVMATRLRAIKQFIDRQLHDSDLRPADIAAHFGISARYLRLIFESDRETLSIYLLRRRLEECARLLRDPAWHCRTITEIAFRVGFNNATHFGCAFKKQYGVTPRDYRRSAGGEAGSRPGLPQ
jgi:AraC family transcriptional regulator, positive regulator of tynA and feaB